MADEVEAGMGDRPQVAVEVSDARDVAEGIDDDVDEVAAAAFVARDLSAEDPDSDADTFTIVVARTGPAVAVVELNAAEARQRCPGVDYRIGHAERLGVGDASLGGVLAWYSLIHTAPDQMGEPLTEFARCVRPGGTLVIGFLEGAELAASTTRSRPRSSGPSTCCPHDWRRLDSR